MEIMFAIGGILSGWMIIISKNPVHSVFSLVLAFANLCILLITLGLDYLPLLFIIVYVGAIAILFLFVIMMLNIKIVEIADNATRYIPVGILIGFIYILQIYDIIKYYINPFIINNNNHNIDNINKNTAVENLGNILYGEFFIYFIVAAFILLIAMVSAIVLTIYHETEVKRQDLFSQITTKYEDTIKYVK